MDFRSSNFKSPDLGSQPWRVRNLKYTDSLKKRCSPHQGCGATEVYNKIFQQLILVLWTLGPRTSGPGDKSLQNFWLHTSSGPKDQGLKVWGTTGPRYPKSQGPNGRGPEIHVTLGPQILGPWTLSPGTYGPGTYDPRIGGEVPPLSVNFFR